LKYRSRPIADLHGVTALVTIAVEHEGHEANPGGGCRRGFTGTANFALEDYHIDYDPGLA
jgi:polyisoprenoid-binding protein YceI